MDTKGCPKCKQELPVDSFYNHTVHWYQAYCKVCSKASQSSGRSARWRKKYPEKHAAQQAIRRADKCNAIPKWADLDAIQDVYLEATYMQLHVDHIIPLKGKTVCGLHVWDNLQLLDPSENKRKGNRYEQ